MNPIHFWAVLGLLAMTAAATDRRGIELEGQRREPGGERVIQKIKIVPARTAVVVVDMWDRHWCKTYTARVANLVPRMNQTLAAARKLGLQVVWVPSDVAAFYQDYPQRKAMADIPTHPEPRAVTFNPAAPPAGLDCCECGPDRPCKNTRVWTRQHAGLEILDGDLIGDGNNAQELFNFCAARDIDTLIYLGVASNMCVCHRPYGMLNARRHGLKVIFVRDLVEAITANGLDPATKEIDWNFTPAKGSARTEHYLEREIAPSLQSRQLLAAAGLGPTARDRRPHLVFVIADDEYKSEQTLPAFAREHLARKFRCTFCCARGNNATNRNDVPGLEALYDADLLVERYIRAGKPLVALRVSTVPFQVDPAQRPEGNVIWRDFDQEVLGCHYRGYNAEARKTGSDVWAVTEARGHPILAGLARARFHSPMWIYRQNPLAPSATVLCKGRWSDQEPEEPVAWTNSYEGGRVFYTTLGHWDDFKNRSFNRLLKNAIRWALGQ